MKSYFVMTEEFRSWGTDNLKTFSELSKSPNYIDWKYNILFSKTSSKNIVFSTPVPDCFVNIPLK